MNTVAQQNNPAAQIIAAGNKDVILLQKKHLGKPCARRWQQRSQAAENASRILAQQELKAFISLWY